jgi:iron complex outermembrane receptor protein
MSKNNPAAGGLLSLCGLALAAAPIAAHAQDAAKPAPQAPASATGQANDAQSLTVSDIMVVGDRVKDQAPIAASLATTQPQAIVGRNLIENLLPATADFTTLATLTPGVSVTGDSNGPGLAETKITLRGFQDAEYNVTYDSIPFSDTNNPTHHSTSYFPANTIETLVVDRGPGNASQLGQATYGGNINLYSRAASKDRSGSIDLTGGSFGTVLGRAEFQSGTLEHLHDARIVLSGEALRSDGALTHEPVQSQNIFAKTVIPLNASNTLTVLGTYNHIILHMSDTAVATCGNTTSITGANCTPTSEIGHYGINYGLSDTASPTSPYAQDYWRYNRQVHNADFEIIRLQSDLGSGVTLDNRVYDYGYSNDTVSGQDGTGGTANTVIPTPGGKAVAGVPGYSKFSRYRTFGYIGQVNYDFSFGRLRVGGWFEHSDSLRNQYDVDLSTGLPNYRESALKYVSSGGLVPNGTPQPPANVKYVQSSSWNQYQLFSELAIRPIAALEITPGVKYMSFTRYVDAAVNQTSRTPLDAHATFTAALPFLTVNYKLASNLSAYFQYAQGMYVPDITSFASPVATLLTSLNNLDPQTSTNYQLGAVFHGSKFALDGDIYLIDVNNKITANPIGDGTLINLGQVRYKGVEGAASVFVTRQLTLFANGSSATAINVTTGQQISRAPLNTGAVGALFQASKLSLAYAHKFTGPQYGAEWTPLPGARLYRIHAYSVGELTVSYRLGRYKFGVNVNNIFNDRSVNGILPNPKGAATVNVKGVAIQSAYGPYDAMEVNSPRSIFATLGVRL